MSGFCSIDAGFDDAMQEQRARARASWKGGTKEAANPAYAKIAETFKTEPDFYFSHQRERLLALKLSSPRAAPSAS